MIVKQATTAPVRFYGMKCLLAAVAGLAVAEQAAIAYQSFQIAEAAATEEWGRDDDKIVGWTQAVAGPGQA